MPPLSQAIIAAKEQAGDFETLDEAVRGGATVRAPRGS
jgi:hypothetical protein